MGNKKICSWLLGSVWLLLTACQPTTVKVTPGVEIPAQYTFAGLAGEGVEVDVAHWWRGWEDAYLNELIERALRNNLDIKAAQARVLEARALADYAHADLGPMVGADAGFGGQMGEVDNNLGTKMNNMAAAILGKKASGHVFRKRH